VEIKEVGAKVKMEMCEGQKSPCAVNQSRRHIALLIPIPSIFAIRLIRHNGASLQVVSVFGLFLVEAAVSLWKHKTHFLKTLKKATVAK
jgi:hypothetical protein